MVELSPIQSKTADVFFQIFAEGHSMRDPATLSMSMIGHACDRHLWLRMRWAEAEGPVDGRSARMMEIYEQDELRLIDDLKSMPVFKVHYKDPRDESLPWTKQPIWNPVALGGHIKGRMVAAITGVPEAPKKLHILMSRALSRDQWRKLHKAGSVQDTRPDHYSHAQFLMHTTGIDRTIYIGINRDNNDLYSERLRHHPEFSTALIKKISRPFLHHEAGLPIQSNNDMPPCMFCQVKGACRFTIQPRRNCRTCLSSTAHADGIWSCDFNKKELSYGEQQDGCDAHRYLPTLINSEVIEASEGQRFVDYKDCDGRVWRDNGPQSD